MANPMRLVEMAVQSNADLDKLERLMDLQAKWEAGQAKKAYLSAMSDFQAICPDIRKMKKAHNSFYAPLGDIIAQIKAPLAQCGLSYRFEQNHNNGISVRCIVSHVDGHSEYVEMAAPADSSGSKNAIQAIASTVSYLSRYTLTGALGIVTADADMDGRLPEQPQFSGNPKQTIIDTLESQGRSIDQFCEWASKVCKREIKSVDDLTERELAQFATKLRNAK